jgi:hypothetical protein
VEKAVLFFSWSDVQIREREKKNLAPATSAKWAFAKVYENEGIPDNLPAHIRGLPSCVQFLNMWGGCSSPQLDIYLTPELSSKVGSQLREPGPQPQFFLIIIEGASEVSWS